MENLAKYIIRFPVNTVQNQKPGQNIFRKKKSTNGYKAKTQKEDPEGQNPGIQGQDDQKADPGAERNGR